MSLEQKRFFESGRKHERDRIVAMLEAKRDEYNEAGLWTLGDGISDAIAYIGKMEEV